MENNIVPTSPGNIEVLKAWAENIEREINEINVTIIPLQKRLDASREKLDLVKRLIHLSAPSDISSLGTIDTTSIQPPTPVIPEIEDRIEEILISSGKPMHIRDIRSLLIKMGVPLPGRGDEANIILRLRRAGDRFIRTERGTYALSKWNMPKYSPAPSKKRIPKQRKITP